MNASGTLFRLPTRLWMNQRARKASYGDDSLNAHHPQLLWLLQQPPASGKGIPAHGMRMQRLPPASSDFQSEIKHPVSRQLTV